MRIRTRNVNDVTIVEVESDAIDASNFRQFKSEIAKTLVPDGRLVLDVAGVNFIDSSGLGALVSCLRQAHDSRGEIKVCGLSKPVRALFELVRMHRVFEIFNTSEEAVNSYRNVA